MIRPTSPALATPFRDPFPGHLPGYLDEIERTSPGRPDPDTYDQVLMERWQALLDSEDSRDESLVQAFLERHPRCCLARTAWTAFPAMARSRSR